MNIAIDVDGVVADLVPKLLSEINHKFKTKYTIEQCTMWNFYDRSGGMFDDPEHADYAVKLMRGAHYAANVRIISGSVDAINRICAAGHTVVWVTAPFRSSKTWAFDRTNWILEHFPACSKHIILTDRKEWVDADILIDDNPENIERWMKGGKKYRKGYLFSQPWNGEFRKSHPQHLILNGWDDRKVQTIIDHV